MGMLYNIVFTGKIREGFDRDSVKLNLIRLFSLSEEKANQILKKPGTILKKEIDKTTGLKYASVLTEAGIKTKMVSITSILSQIATKPDELYLNPLVSSLEIGRNCKDAMLS